MHCEIITQALKKKNENQYSGKSYDHINWENSNELRDLQQEIYATRIP